MPSHLQRNSAISHSALRQLQADRGRQKPEEDAAGCRQDQELPDQAGSRVDRDRDGQLRQLLPVLRQENVSPLLSESSNEFGMQDRTFAVFGSGGIGPGYYYYMTDLKQLKS